MNSPIVIDDDDRDRLCDTCTEKFKSISFKLPIKKKMWKSYRIKKSYEKLRKMIKDEKEEEKFNI